VRAILTYHSVDNSGSVISVSPALFERHVRWLASGHVAVVGLFDLLRIDDDRDAVAITFDDAYTNFQTEAWPRLREYGLPVTLFVPTRHVGGTNRWGAMPGGRMPELPILDWLSLSRLGHDGVTLGAHSRSHPDLRSLDAAALRDEVCGSIEDIERETGRRPEAFAYPYGYWNLSVASVVRNSALCACTTALGPLGPADQMHLLPRLDAFYLVGPARLEDFGRWTFRAYVQARAGVRAAGQWARGKFHT
jgi:peptidoglycan/xylan/chitin deacetylase (PgdA/CDA1 family)